ncbi:MULTISPECIES: TetR/AcrR family transcriptional regulator [unclassified Vibrio]|uniref:TetR/AcrR family transcriptional regulator n=1 Tax=Vibrio sp. HB236076 TaxID=3232307 RepID=A0AB39HK65_9VIBR|nr:TetR/AcrR family transcriptional regulator [Vibrio sp. HB161653]MDP5252776.1 TetR/AcrR family transcriptional regulator [Vibrio sp. HB161653]
MSESHRRNKDPIAVKKALINAAVHLALEGGILAITTQAVCKRAGVSKGALTHHYLNKQALLSSVFDSLIALFETELFKVLSDDDVTDVAFTKAYVETCFKTLEDEHYRPIAALSTLLIGDEDCRQQWKTWLEGMLNQYQVTDQSLQCQLARYTADGVWYNRLIGNGPTDVHTLKEKILHSLLSI